jgi:hypothetical protein
MEWLSPATPVLALCVNVLVQAGLCRRGQRLSLLKTVYVGFAAGATVVPLGTGAAWWFGDGRWSDGLALLVLNALTYGALGYGYFHFINLGETARRVRLLRELIEAGGALTEEEVLRRYNGRDILEARLGRLLRAGQVVERGGRFRLGHPTVLRMARGLVWGKILILGRSGELPAAAAVSGRGAPPA